MEQVLHEFILALKGSGLKISTSESIDVMNVVKVIGYSDNKVLKDALSSVCAKSLLEKEIFSKCFDTFFGFCTYSKKNVDKQKNNITTDLKLINIEKSTALSQMLFSDNVAGIASLVNDAARKAHITNIQYFTQKSVYVRKILHYMGIDQVDYDINHFMMKDDLSARLAAKHLEKARQRLYEVVRDFVEQQFSMFSNSVSEKLIENYLKKIKLTNIERKDLDKIHSIIKKIVKRLNDLQSRRRKIDKKGVIDFRKTLRANTLYQGILFDIKWKKKKINRPDIVVLCDISRSVKWVVRFLLLFLYSLNESYAKIRSYVFCSNLVSVSNLFDEHEVEEAIDRIQRAFGIGVVLGQTDYGQAFCDFIEKGYQSISRKTTLIIMGDARNNFCDPRVKEFKTISDKCRQIIWLNPESQSFWGTGDSEMIKYMPYCRYVFECNTVKHLEKVACLLI